MGHIGRIALSLLVIHILILCYANRAVLTSRYDATYWKDRYEHSQWRLPLSLRTLGDNGLYAYEGYVLTKGEDPTKYNAEIPPLGKYAIGAVTRLTGSSSLYGALSGLVALALVFIVSKKFLKKTAFAAIVTLWFALDPLFVSQWPATMLDTIHLSSLLLFILAWHEIDPQIHPRVFIICTGIAVGIFSAVKYPILSVMLVAVGSVYLWKKIQSFLYVALFLLIAGFTYAFTFIKYFLLGHTIIQWIQLQKWMFSFYFHSKLEANIGSIWTTLLANRYQNLFTKTWQSSSEWSATWPVITLVSLIVCFRLLSNPKTRKRFFGFLSITILGISLFYTFTTFWTRYLTLLLPFLYMATAGAIKKIKQKWILVAIVFGFAIINGYASWHILFPTPESEVNQFVYDWEHGFFADMYERFTVNVKTANDRYAFNRSMQKFVSDGEIEHITISSTPPSWSRVTSPQYITLDITYSTRNLGEFSQTSVLPVINESGLWRIPWDNDYFIENLQTGSSLQTTVIPGKRGSIIDNNKSVLAEDFTSSMIWITPKNVDSGQEEKMLKSLETIFGYPAYSAINFYHRYSTNSQPDWPVPIAVISKHLDETALTTLSQFPGITLTPAIGRYESPDNQAGVGTVANTHFFECCSSLYSTTTYDGVSGLEQAYNARLKGENGGTLVIINDKGEIIRTLIQKEKKDGEDISL